MKNEKKYYESLKRCQEQIYEGGGKWTKGTAFQ